MLMAPLFEIRPGSHRSTGVVEAEPALAGELKDDDRGAVHLTPPVRRRLAATPASLLAAGSARRDACTMLSAAPTATTATPAVALHVRQRELVAASLIAVPGATRSTHRRWA
jgi:hypothetical protein